MHNEYTVKDENSTERFKYFEYNSIDVFFFFFVIYLLLVNIRLSRSNWSTLEIFFVRS